MAVLRGILVAFLICLVSWPAAAQALQPTAAPHVGPAPPRLNLTVPAEQLIPRQAPGMPADIYEGDVAGMHLGQVARLEVQGGGAPLEAKVAFVPPTIDEPTRTLKVRFELANERRLLRPGAFANVSMDLTLGRGLAVPESAVIRTGTRAIVFVVHDGKHVMPREVALGPLVESFYRVEGGLDAGDVVATGAQFLLDSETRLRASSGVGTGHGGH